MRYTHTLKAVRHHPHLFKFSFIFLGISTFAILLLGSTYLDAKIFFSGFVQSLTRVTIAYGISVFFSLTVALILSESKRTEEIFLPILDVLQSFPSFAMYPLFLLWFGRSTTITILILVIEMIWPILFTTLTGIKQIREDILEAAHSYGATGWKYHLYVLFPLLLPSIVTGSIVAWGEAWETIIAAEIVINVSGVGTYLAGLNNGRLLSIGIIMLLTLLFFLNKLIWLPLLNISTKYQQE